VVAPGERRGPGPGGFRRPRRPELHLLRFPLRYPPSDGRGDAGGDRSRHGDPALEGCLPYLTRHPAHRRRAVRGGRGVPAPGPDRERRPPHRLPPARPHTRRRRADSPARGPRLAPHPAASGLGTTDEPGRTRTRVTGRPVAGSDERATAAAKRSLPSPVRIQHQWQRIQVRRQQRTTISPFAARYAHCPVTAKLECVPKGPRSRAYDALDALGCSARERSSECWADGRTGNIAAPNTLTVADSTYRAGLCPHLLSVAHLHCLRRYSVASKCARK
jgi:hypothetical protein